MSLLKRLRFPLAGVAVAAAAAFVLLGGKDETVAKPVAPKAEDLPFVATAQGKADVEGGMIQVASRRPGVIQEVYVQEGEEVRRGQILARQDSEAASLNLQTAQAALARAEADVAPARIQLATATRERERLDKISDIVSRVRVDQQRDAQAEAQATLLQRSSAIQVARAQLAEARYQLEQTVVRAPVDGVIVRRYANPGTGASTLNVTSLFDLLPNTRRIVRAEVTENVLQFVKAGGRVALSPESDTSRSYDGEVLRKVTAFGTRRLQEDDPSGRSDERVLEVVIDATSAPFTVGQRVLVRFHR